MKRITTSAMIALFATMAVSIAAPTKEAIMAKENAAWQTFKDKKADAFQKVVDKDVRLVYADGVGNMQKELAEMSKWDVKSFTISDFDMFSDEKDVVVATYTVKIDATYQGKDMSGTYIAGTVWKQENGDWLAIFHTHTKAEPMTGMDGQKRE
jgi:hypothetical protein